MFHDASPRSEISGNPSYYYEITFLQHDTMGSRWYLNLDEKRGVGTDELCGSRLLFHVPKDFLSCLVPIGKKMMPNSLNSRRELRMVLVEQAGFQKRFLRYPQYSVCRAVLWDSEYPRVGWERGMLQSWSLSQDRKKILLPRPRNSPCSVNPEFESRADSLALTIHQCSIVWLYLFLRNRFIEIPQFLGSVLHDFLGRIHFSFPFLQIN